MSLAAGSPGKAHRKEINAEELDWRTSRAVEPAWGKWDQPCYGRDADSAGSGGYSSPRWYPWGSRRDVDEQRPSRSLPLRERGLDQGEAWDLQRPGTEAEGLRRH